MARFKEAYKLVKNREKASVFKALSLGFELFGNYSLHPAIITACNSLDELDIYLACLDENDLDDFKFFNIKYEVSLALTQKRTESFFIDPVLFYIFLIFFMFFLINIITGINIHT